MLKNQYKRRLCQLRQSDTVYYPSSYEPWGYYANYHSNPGFVPLTYALKEAHKCGLEFHAWFNTYHVSSTYPGTPAPIILTGFAPMRTANS